MISRIAFCIAYCPPLSFQARNVNSGTNLISVTPAMLAPLVISLSRILPSSRWPDYPFPNQLAKAMHRFEVLLALFSVTQPILGTAYIPGKPFSLRKYADSNQVVRRDCVAAAPNVSASAVGHHKILFFWQLLLTPSRSLRMHADRTIRPIPQHARTRCKFSWARVSAHGLPFLTEVHQSQVHPAIRGEYLQHLFKSLQRLQIIKQRFPNRML